VLEAVEHEMLDPEVVALAVNEAMALLRSPVELDPGRAAALNEELRELLTAIGRLTAAIRLGRRPALLVAELQTAERRRAVIEQALRVLFDGERAVFTPQESGQVVEVVATCTLDRLSLA
jgi:hypothetical protein